MEPRVFVPCYREGIDISAAKEFGEILKYDDISPYDLGAIRARAVTIADQFTDNDVILLLPGIQTTLFMAYFSVEMCLSNTDEPPENYAVLLFNPKTSGYTVRNISLFSYKEERQEYGKN